MAAKTERIKVEVTDSTESETRTFKIVLMAPNGDFQLADLLRQRGVIPPINGELKTGCEGGASKLFGRRRGTYLDTDKSFHGTTEGRQ
jgi:hypothetical protein